MKLSRLLLAFALAASLQAAPRAWRSGDALDRVIVQWTDAAESQRRLNPKADPASALHAQAGAIAVRRAEILPIDTVSLPAGSGGQEVDRALALYRASPWVLLAEPDAPVKAASAPNDPVYVAGQQWGLTATAWPQAWAAYPAVISFRAQVIVAVLDTGLDAHNDLVGQALSGVSYLPSPEDSTDDRNGHGTFCAGLIAALPDNGAGISGAFLDPAFVRILPVKVLDACGGGAYSSVLNGVLYATARGARVINLSLTGVSESDAMHNALVAARERGALVVAAAGNDAGATGYPASDSTVLAVGALDANNAPAWYSNYGKIDLSAPGGAGTGTCPCATTAAGCGGEIWSLTAVQPGCSDPDSPNPACGTANALEAAAGTSFAAPLVSAAAAMLFAQDPNLSPVQAQQRLLQSAVPSSEGAGFHARSGWGKLNFYGALAGARSAGAAAALRVYNWPNPFSPARDGGTTFSFFLPGPQAAELRLIDAGGDLVRRWSLGANETWAGMNLLPWDGKNGVGRPVANGGYLMVLESQGGRASCRVAVLQ